MAANTPTVADGDVAVHNLVMTAATVDVVTFTNVPGSVEVLSHDGVAEIYFTVDGSTPTVGGPRTFCVAALAGAATCVRIIGSVVKLISVGTPKYSVTRVA